MTMTFSYRSIVKAQPIYPLRERMDRPRPVIPVTLLGDTGSWLVDALLDTGADDTVFPDHLAAMLGLDLSQAPSGAGTGIVAGQVTIRYAKVRLRVGTNTEHREWEAIVGFAPITNRYPVLGFAGFLQYFTVTFHGDREEVDLTVNALYPGV